MSLEEDYDDEVVALYRKYAGDVLGFLINTGCDYGLAEEITDDAFLATRRYWARVRTFDEPKGYVFKVARNERTKRQKKHDDRAKDLHPDPLAARRDAAGDDLAPGVADRAVVRDALRQLPPRQREAVMLRDAAGLSEAVTAEIMRIKKGSVKRYTSQGRKELRRLLAEFRHRPEGNDR
jgi:RNA polymerase sigma factor (sigma-70 family)